MSPTIATLSPRQTFEDNMRPALQLLHVYRLLDSNDIIHSEGELVTALRQVVGADEREDLLLIYNEVFLGLVRESAQLPRSHLRHHALCNLLRQAVVASCTALETYLPALLSAHLPIMIRARGREFVPWGDADLASYFAGLTFTLDETLRLLANPDAAAEYIAKKVLGLVGFKYLSGRKGIVVTGKLLGINKPAEEIAARLERNKDELMKTVDDTVARRNNIVHRADRPQDDPRGAAQTITYVWTQQAVDVINHVCLALDELVTAHAAELMTMLSEGLGEDGEVTA